MKFLVFQVVYTYIAITFMMLESDLRKEELFKFLYIPCLISIPVLIAIARAKFDFQKLISKPVDQLSLSNCIIQMLDEILIDFFVLLIVGKYTSKIEDKDFLVECIKQSENYPVNQLTNPDMDPRKGCSQSSTIFVTVFFQICFNIISSSEIKANQFKFVYFESLITIGIALALTLFALSLLWGS